MNKIELIVISALLLTFGAWSSATVAAQRIDKPTVERQQAEKAFEALIRAKGGRENLGSVRNMLTQYSDVTILDSFPCSQWNFGYWLDGLPSLRVYNHDEKLRVIAGKSGPERMFHENLEDSCWYAQIPFLLETKSYKPVPINVTREKEESKTHDVLTVVVGSAQLSFVYEPEEMLVTEVRFISGGEVWQKYRFDKYTNINGIKMPTLFSVGISANHFVNIKFMPISFQFNVDYDPKIFDPPFVATSPDAWKRKQ